jgi:hypothetical protein
MPCVSRRVKGSSESDQAFVAHQLVEEARVQQVQDGVLDAADVLVHGQPVVGALRVQHALVVVGAGETGVVPGRLHEGVEGVRLALAGDAVEVEFPPLRVRLQWRGDAVHDHVLGQQCRQAGGGYRDLTAALGRLSMGIGAPQ